MWHIGTRFVGKGNYALSKVCVVNYLDDRNMGYIVMMRENLSMPIISKPRYPFSIKDATAWVEDGSWIILSQPFEVYLKEIEKL